MCNDKDATWQALAYNRTLRKVDMYWNNIGNKGLEAICNTLRPDFPRDFVLVLSHPPTHTHTQYTQIHAHMHTCTHTHNHTHTRAHTHTLTHTSTRAHTCGVREKCEKCEKCEVCAMPCLGETRLETCRLGCALICRDICTWICLHLGYAQCLGL